MKKFGLVQDGDPHNTPEGMSRYSLNSNLTDDTAQSEESTYSNDIPTIIPFPDCVGRIPITDNQTVYFLRAADTTTGIVEEIGIVSDNGAYQKIIAFNATNKLDLSATTRLQGTFKVNYNGDIIIYWVDDINVPRWLNINSPQITMNNDRVATGNIMFLQIFPDFLQCDINDAQISVGGGLVSGSYTVALGYATSQFNYTPVFYYSQPVDVVSSINTSPPSEFDGDPPGTPTSKQITLSIGGGFPIDTNYKYLEVYVGAHINGVTTWYKYGDLGITATTMQIAIQTLTDKETVPEEQVTVPPAKYLTAKTITQLDDYLYMGNLTQAPDPGLQPYVNNIRVDYATDVKSINPAVSEAFRTATVLFKEKSFMWNEVYALYISFVTIDGTETKAYHIPGRERRLMVQADGTKNSFPIPGDATSQISKNPGVLQIYENTLLSDILTNTEVLTNAAYPQENTVGYNWSPVDEMGAIAPTAKYFDAFNTGDCSILGTPNMGYHENHNERYPNNELWDVKNAAGVVTGSLRTFNVRHHRLPHASYSANTITTMGAGSTLASYKEQKIIGFDISNIILPPDFAATVHGVKIYYAKRTAENRTILGQSIILEDAGVQYNAIAYGNLSEQHIGANLRLNSISDGGGNNLAVFPTSIWNEFLGTPQRTTAEYLTQSKFRNAANTVDTYRNFVSMHNFDQMFFQDAVSRASYIRPVYKFNSQYTNVYINNANGGGGAAIIPTQDFEAGFQNNTNDPTYGIVSATVTRHGQKNSIRRFANSPVYMTANLQSNASFGNKTRDWTTFAPAFDKTSNPRNYFGEKYILGELTNRLASETNGPLATPTRPYPKLDSGLMGLDFNTSVETANISNRTSTFYLSDLCAYKTDIYQNFDDQELVCCAPLVEIHPTGPTYELLDSVYSGDTVISFYGVKSHCELGGIRNSAPGSDRFLILKFLHYFICQSNANINFRYEDPTDSNRIYFPKSTALSLLTISPIYDNWYGYDPMHNKLNDSKQPVTQSPISIEEATDFPNRIIRSDKNNTDAFYDNFLSYTANDYVDVGRNRGDLWLLSIYDNKLIIHNQRGMFVTMGREVLKTTNLQAYVGSGDIFEVKPQEFTNMEAGFGGIQHQWAGITTPYGYIFPDDRSGKVFMYGKGLTEMSKMGMQNFFRETFGFRIEDYLKGSLLTNATTWDLAISYTTIDTVVYNNKIYNCIIASTGEQPDFFPDSWLLVADLSLPLLNQDDPIMGVGYHATYDIKYERYILTKRDYTVQENGGFPARTLARAFNPVMTGFLSGLYYLNGRLAYIAPDITGFPPDSFIETIPVVVGGVPGTAYYTTDMRVISLIDGAYLEGLQLVPYHYTVTFHVDDPTIGSFMSYTPEVYINVGSRYFSYITNTNWRHNSSDIHTNAFLFIYGTSANFIVEPILNEPKQAVKILSSVFLETKCYDTTRLPGDLPNNVTPPRIVMETFDSYQVYDSFQISSETTGVNTSTERYVDGYWRFNDFRDCVINHNNPLFLTDGINRVPNTANIDSARHWSLKKRFVDYWFGTRLIYNGFKKLVLISIFGNVRKNAR